MQSSVVARPARQAPLTRRYVAAGARSSREGSSPARNLALSATRAAPRDQTNCRSCARTRRSGRRCRSIVGRLPAMVADDVHELVDRRSLLRARDKRDLAGPRREDAACRRGAAHRWAPAHRTNSQQALQTPRKRRQRATPEGADPVAGRRLINRSLYCLSAEPRRAGAREPRKSARRRAPARHGDVTVPLQPAGRAKAHKQNGHSWSHIS